MLSGGIGKFQISLLAWYQSTDDQAMAHRAKFAEGDMIKSDIQELPIHQLTSQQRFAHCLLNENQPIRMQENTALARLQNLIQTTEVMLTPEIISEVLSIPRAELIPALVALGKAELEDFQSKKLETYTALHSLIFLAHLKAGTEASPLTDSIVYLEENHLFDYFNDFVTEDFQLYLKLIYADSPHLLAELAITVVPISEFLRATFIKALIHQYAETRDAVRLESINKTLDIFALRAAKEVEEDEYIENYSFVLASSLYTLASEGVLEPFAEKAQAWHGTSLVDEFVYGGYNKLTQIKPKPGTLAIADMILNDVAQYYAKHIFVIEPDTKLQDAQMMQAFAEQKKKDHKKSPPIPIYSALRSLGQPKVVRNEPCPCNSGKKYKRCCGK